MIVTALLELNHLARISAERMLNCMLEGMAIGLFAWILLQVVGRRNSSTRFAVWFFALLAIAALPVLSGAASSAGSAKAGVDSAITVPASWALGVFALWVLIAAVALARVGFGMWQLRKLRANCIPVDAAALPPLLRSTLQGFQTIRSVELCQSDRLQVPAAIGFLKPAVVIPAWALQELSPADLNSILLHELAHLRRWDDWTNLAQQVLQALLFFHPAVWWIKNQLALEREMACDDAVLAETANPRDYAECLISLAEKSFLRRGLALAQAVVNRLHQTSLRVSQILDRNRSRATQVWKPALYSVAAFSLLCLAASSHAPQLVAFEGQPPTLAAAVASPVGVPVPAGASNSLPKDAAVRLRAIRAEWMVRPSRAAFVRRASPKQNLPRPIEARFKQPKANQSTPAKTAAFIDHDIASQTIMVVMQTEQYEQTGPTLWRLCVWRVVVFDSNQTPSPTRIPAKQI